MTEFLAPAYRFLFTGDHETIIYSAVKRLSLTPQHPDYDDYLQEGRLLFPQIYARFPEDPEEKPHQFLAYAHQKLYWEMCDRRRKDFKQQNQLEEGEADPLLDAVPAADDSEAIVLQRELFENLCRVISRDGTQGEWHYLMGTLLEDRTVSEIATKYRVSRNTVYRWRQALFTHVRSCGNLF